MRLNQFKIGQRLAIGFGAVVALMMVTSGLAYMQFGKLEQASAQAQELQRMAAVADQWRVQVNLNGARALAVVKSGGSKELDALFQPQMAATSKDIAALQEDLRKVVDSDKGKALLADIAAKRQSYTTVRENILSKQRAGDPVAAELVDTAMQPAWLAYTGALEALTVYQQERLTASNARTAANLSRANLLVLCLLAAAAAAAALFGWAISRSITAPLRQTITLIERIAAGDLSGHIAVQGRDESAAMTESLARMQDVLKRLVGEVRGSGDSIATASSQIASGNLDLSSRTEQAAGNLQEAAASLEQITGTVGQTAESARTRDTAVGLGQRCRAPRRRGGVAGRDDDGRDQHQQPQDRRDHRHHRRHRVPDQHPGAECRRRGRPRR